MSPVLKLKNDMLERYSFIITTSTLQKAKGLTLGFFIVKTPMFIECLMLHCFSLWSSMKHTSIKLLYLLMQVMASFFLYSTSPISLLSLSLEASMRSGNKQWLSLFTSNAKTFFFQVSHSPILLSCDEWVLLKATTFHQTASISKLLIQTTRL